MRLLDVIDEALARMGTDAPLIEVFDASYLPSQEAYRDYIPGLPMVFHTPVAGVSHDGVLRERAEGYDARELVARMFGSSSDEIVEFVMLLQPFARVNPCPVPTVRPTKFARSPSPAATPGRRPAASSSRWAARPCCVLAPSKRPCRRSSSAAAKVGSRPNTACCPVPPAAARPAIAAARSTAGASKSNGSSAAASGPSSISTTSANARCGSTATFWKRTAARAPRQLAGRSSRVVDALTVLHESADAYRNPAGVPLSPPTKPSAVLKDSIAAISVGLLDGAELLDLEYSEDRDAEVDFNVVMTGSGAMSKCRAAARRRFRPGPTGSLARYCRPRHRRRDRGPRTALGERWPFSG